MSKEESKARKEFNDYIRSIGGLESGYRTDLGPMYDVGWVGDGWLPLLKELIQDLIGLGWNKQICDIKEKFGGLRFYIAGGSDEIFDRIDKAESDSYKICETCGEPGEPTQGGWIKTLCYNCIKTKQR
jgi:hypothetical protein